jgi:hypothetical protein
LPLIFFKIDDFGDHGACLFSVEAEDAYDRAVFDVIKDAKPYLGSFKHELGLDLSEYGYRLPSKLLLSDLLKLDDTSEEIGRIL